MLYALHGVEFDLVHAFLSGADFFRFHALSDFMMYLDLVRLDALPGFMICLSYALYRVCWIVRYLVWWSCDRWRR